MEQKFKVELTEESKKFIDDQLAVIDATITHLMNAAVNAQVVWEKPKKRSFWSFLMPWRD